MDGNKWASLDCHAVYSFSLNFTFFSSGDLLAFFFNLPKWLCTFFALFCYCSSASDSILEYISMPFTLHAMFHYVDLLCVLTSAPYNHWSMRITLCVCLTLWIREARKKHINHLDTVMLLEHSFIYFYFISFWPHTRIYINTYSTKYSEKKI